MQCNKAFKTDEEIFAHACSVERLCSRCGSTYHSNNGKAHESDCYIAEIGERTGKMRIQLVQRSAIRICSVRALSRAKLRRRRRGARTRHQAAQRRRAILCADRGVTAANQAPSQLVYLAPATRRSNDTRRRERVREA